jgi:hypothetical protein
MNQFNGLQPQYQPSDEDDELLSAINDYRQEKFQPPQQPQFQRPVSNVANVSQLHLNQQLPHNQQLPNHSEAQQAINTLNKLWEQGQVNIQNSAQPQNQNTSITPFEFSFMVNGVPVTVKIG